MFTAVHTEVGDINYDLSQGSCHFALFLSPLLLRLLFSLRSNEMAKK